MEYSLPVESFSASRTLDWTACVNRLRLLDVEAAIKYSLLLGRTRLLNILIPESRIREQNIEDQDARGVLEVLSALPPGHVPPAG